MQKRKLLLALSLFSAGILGILSLLTVDLELPFEVKEELLKEFSEKQIKWLVLVNPSILLLGAVVLGTALYENNKLHIPILENKLDLKKSDYNLILIVKYGLIGGLFAGILIGLCSVMFEPYFPEDFIRFGEKFQPSLWSRFLYGGITEEILMRFGLMNLLVLFVSKIFRHQKRTVYVIAILLSALLFALGHLPVVMQNTQKLTPSLLSYILVANGLGGVIFGWLYWKKGLESSMIAHVITHMILVTVSYF